MRNPFSRETLRDIALRLSRPSRTILLAEIATIKAEYATLQHALDEVKQLAEAQYRNQTQTATAQNVAVLQALAVLNDRLDQVQQAGTEAARLDQERFSALETGLRQQRDQLAPYLPRRFHESFDLGHFARLQAAETSAELFTRHLYDKPTFAIAEDLIAHCLGLLDSRASLPLEFGVYSGRTINAIADTLGPDVQVYGFDSFEGLPETWRTDFRKGHFAMENLPEVRSNVHLVKGWFNETLPGFRDTVMAARKTNFIHVDCDLYSSTKTILTELRDHIADDAIVIFDEFFNYPGWEQHEYRAFHEYLESTGRGFDYIGCVPFHQQVAVRLRPA